MSSSVVVLQLARWIEPSIGHGGFRSMKSKIEKNTKFLCFVLFVLFTSYASAQVPYNVLCPEHQYKSAGVCLEKCLDRAKWSSKSKQCVCESEAFLLARKSDLFSSKHQRVCLKKCISDAVWDRKSKSCSCQSESFELIENKRGQQFCTDRCRLESYSHWDSDQKICTCPQGTEKRVLSPLKKDFMDRALHYPTSRILPSQEHSLSFGGKQTRRVASLPCDAIKCHDGRWSKQKKKCLGCPSGTTKVSYFCIANEDIGGKVWNKDRSTFKCSKGNMYCKSLYICLEREAYSYYACDRSHPF